ncbi:MAG: DUF2029 domain-containing protein [Hyphomicrobiaceae bacterium]|nr:MAG: DUF2029 domain-containing protein [Hyphomicrobiaceae bacterium]
MTVAPRRSGRRSLRLVLPGAIAFAVLWLISEPALLFSDFYKAYYPTAEMLLQAGPRATWPADELCVSGFANLPILAWAFVPLVHLGQVAGAWLFFAVGVAAVLGAWALLVRSAQPDAQCGAALLCLFLVNGPLVNSLREGNTTHFVLFLLVATLLLWRAGREYLAGLVLGLGAVIKLPLLLYGAYFIVRRRWHMVAGGATTVAATALLSVAVFGTDINIGWYQYCVEPFVGGAIPAFNVQSVDGFLIRLATGDTRLRDWDPVGLSAAHRLARAAIVITLFGGTLWLIRRADHAAPAPGPAGALGARDLIEFSLVLGLAIVTSPIAWTHYYLLLLLPWGLYLGGNLHLPGDATTRRLMYASIGLSSLPVVIPPIDLGAWSGLAARTIVSAWLAGGLLMLSALVRGAWLAPGQGRTQSGGETRSAPSAPP